MRITPALFVSASLIWATGCATHHGVSRAEANRALESSLRTELTRYGDLAANAPNVRIEANDGTVTLSGTVTTEKDREMLTTLARNTSGVYAVNDQLRVLSPTGRVAPARVYSQPTLAQPAPIYSATPPTIVPGTVIVAPIGYPGLRIMTATPADEMAARQLGEQLAADKIPAAWLDNVTLNVVADNVYVQGVADSAAARQTILSSISRARGVKAVYDQLRLR